MIKRATREQGFTLVEMAVTLVVLAIATGYAIPAYQSLSADSAIRGTTMNLVAAINEARSQSYATRANVVLKATDNSSWSNGWSLTDTGTRSWQPSNSKNTVVVNPSTITATTFQASGFISTTSLTFTICDDRTGEQGRKITLEKNGKVENDVVTCS